MIGRGFMERVVSSKPDVRKYLLRQEFAAFAGYYFPDFFTYKVPGFQWAMYQLLNQFAAGKFRFLLWIMFRESAKTTITKIYIIYCIVFRIKRFINWDSFDKGNSEAALFDIASWLQTNRKLIEDFGQMFYEDPKMVQRQAKIKRINEFVTSNKVKVKAYSTQESTRGRIFDKFRPDLYVVDDFETFKTIESAPVTDKIVKHIDELKAGLSVDGQVIFLGNLISENAVVASLLSEATENPDAWRYQRVDVEMNGEIAWPDKYTRTQIEASAANASIADPKARKVSLEQKRKDLNAGGRKVYEAEMMNNPEASGEPFFDREKVNKAIALARLKHVQKQIGDFQVWELYVAKHRYGIGADTAKGVSRDSCASCAIRFKKTDTDPAVVVGTYASNIISPDLFGYELRNQGDYFGQCIVAPELNNTGYATVTQLKNLKYPFMYRQQRKDDVGAIITDHLGWEATTNNVADIYYAYRTAFEDAELLVYDPGLLDEMRRFTKRDLTEASKRQASVTMAGATRHFDKLRAACIAWEMRHYAIVGKAGRPAYKQKESESPSEYRS